jgi:hypothetical protein
MTTDKDIADQMNDDFDTAMLNGDYAKAQQMMNKLWLDSMIFMTTKTNPELKELSYINVTVDTGDGTYVLAFMHTGGKKLQLQKPEVKP